MGTDWITPDWPAPANVRAVSTTRTDGVSRGAYASFNLGTHVGDDPRAVAENRLSLRGALNLSHEPRWLTQVHGSRVITLEDGSGARTAADSGESPQGDAAVARTPGPVCVIMTADCLPVLFCDRAGTAVAAAHAGWRGLAAGVLETTLAAMRTSAGDVHVLAWLGPAIGQQAYIVGEEVRQAFLAEQGQEADQAFEPASTGKWHCDLYQLASQRLRRAGIRQVYGGGFCTYTQSEQFFSYRRDGECGRMATLIWLAE